MDFLIHRRSLLFGDSKLYLFKENKGMLCYYYITNNNQITFDTSAISLLGTSTGGKGLVLSPSDIINNSGTLTSEGFELKKYKFLNVEYENIKTSSITRKAYVGIPKEQQILVSDLTSTSSSAISFLSNYVAFDTDVNVRKIAYIPVKNLDNRMICFLGPTGYSYKIYNIWLE